MTKIASLITEILLQAIKLLPETLNRPHHGVLVESPHLVLYLHHRAPISMVFFQFREIYLETFHVFLVCLHFLENLWFLLTLLSNIEPFKAKEIIMD